jgi:hypothetical protein
MSGKVLLFGLGDLGGWVLEFLVRTEGLNDIMVGERNKEEAEKKIFNVKAGAAYMGRFPNIEYIFVDVNNVDQTAALISAYNPDIIANFTTLHSWRVIGEDVPFNVLMEIETAAGLGPWIPMHLTLTKKIMEATKLAGVDIPVVNASFPDAVNAILAKLNMPPTVGIGNSDLLIPGIKFVIAKKFGVKPAKIKVYFVAHHCHEVLLLFTKSTFGRPYFLKVMVEDRDVTDQLDVDNLLYESIQYEPEGAKGHPMVAASAVKNIAAILNDSGLKTHAPGPNGLIGGYDVELTASGAEVIVPDGITLTEAIEINEEAQKGDGIEKIKDDGTVILTTKAYEIMHRYMGYDIESFHPDETDVLAKRIKKFYEAFKKKYK